MADEKLTVQLKLPDFWYDLDYWINLVKRSDVSPAKKREYIAYLKEHGIPVPAPHPDVTAIPSGKFLGHDVRKDNG